MKSWKTKWNILMVLAFLVPAVGMAQNFTQGEVVDLGSTGDYNTASNWSLGAVPSGGNPSIKGGRTAVLSSAAPDVNAFLLGATFVATNGADLSANTLYTTRAGLNGEVGNIKIYDGGNLYYRSAVTGLSMGWDANSTATVDMYGGFIGKDGGVGRANLYMAQANVVSHNTLNMMGGTMQFASLLAGFQAGSTGADSLFDVSGGIVDFSATLSIGQVSDATFRVDGSGSSSISAGGILKLYDHGTLQFVLDSAGVTPIDLGNKIEAYGGLFEVDASAYTATGRVSLITYATDFTRFSSNNLTFANGMSGYLEYGSDSLDLVVIPEPMAIISLIFGGGFLLWFRRLFPI